jgi:hypothetical protein
MVSQKKSRRRKLEVTHETKVAQQSFFWLCVTSSLKQWHLLMKP